MKLFTGVFGSTCKASLLVALALAGNELSDIAGSMKNVMLGLEPAYGKGNEYAKVKKDGDSVPYNDKNPSSSLAVVHPDKEVALVNVSMIMPTDDQTGKNVEAQGDHKASQGKLTTWTPGGNLLLYTFGAPGVMDEVMAKIPETRMIGRRFVNVVAAFPKKNNQDGLQPFQTVLVDPVTQVPSKSWTSTLPSIAILKEASIALRLINQMWKVAKTGFYHPKGMYITALTGKTSVAASNFNFTFPNNDLSPSQCIKAVKLHPMGKYINNLKKLPRSDVSNVPILMAVFADHVYEATDHGELHNQENTYDITMSKSVMIGQGKEVHHAMLHQVTDKTKQVTDKTKSFRVLSFPGTQSIKDIVRDAELTPTQFCGLKGFVHLGFKQALLSFAEAGQAWHAMWHTIFRERSKLYITGHSLGAAIATLCYFCLAYGQKDNVDYLTLFQGANMEYDSATKAQRAGGKKHNTIKQNKNGKQDLTSSLRTKRHPVITMYDSEAQEELFKTLKQVAADLKKAKKTN